MRKNHSPLAIVAVSLCALGLAIFLGCEGEQGPAGPEGPPGPGGEEVDYTYLGENGEACKHCHVHNVETVMNTGHTMAYDDLDEEDRANLYCLSCHTTGFDSEVEDGDTEIEVYGPDLYGYDDYVGLEGDEAAMRRAMLEGVQCESCHGPMGPDFNDHKPLLSFATGVAGDVSLSLCDPCHQTQLEEWVDSGHGTVTETLEEFNEEHYVDNSSCEHCHVSEGFIKANDPAYATYSFEEPFNFIGCPTCHDPHAGEEDEANIHQIRTLDDVEVVYTAGLEPGDPGVPTMSGYDTGQLCAQCHHARRDTDNVLGQIAEGSSHFGPHGSPQMDTFIGAGCYEIEGEEYDRTHVHQGIPNACVTCHMVRETELEGELQDHAFHTFEPTTDNCMGIGCHGVLPDFDYNGVQTTVGEKMDELAVLFGFADAEAFLAEETGWDSEAEGVEEWQREAAYALVFVSNDGSMGVHNPDYVMDLLNHAIDYYEENAGKFAAR